MGLFILWVFLCFVLGFIGSGRKIGYWGVFFLSLILSPLIGLIFGLASRRLTEREVKNYDRFERIYVNNGQKSFDKKDYNNAASNWLKSLEYSTKKSDIHFRLASAYSMMSNKSESLFHLNKSFENGFNDIEKINKSLSLEFLREQTEFKTFVSNGYKVTSNQNKVESHSIADELTKLNELKEKGVISDDEFNSQKSKILAKE